MNSFLQHSGAALLLFLVSPGWGWAQSEKIGVIYIKNNGPAASLWINDYYQGIAPANRTCYTVIEGFVTSDSGFQPDGRLVLKDSHAGWEASGVIDFLAIAPEQKNGEIINNYWTGKFPDAGKELLLWIGGSPAIDAWDRENAGQILRGSAGNLSKDTVIKNGEPAEGSEGMGGEANTGTALPMMVAGMSGLRIISPSNGYATRDRIVTIQGTVKDSKVSTVTLNVNGRDSIAEVSGGEFKGVVSLTVGDNRVIARANQGSAKSRAVVVTCTDEPSQLWVELVWDGPGDVDLHTRQPDGEDVAFDNKHPSGGGQLDVDNTAGYGPEHYFISAARGDDVSAGTYSIYLVDYRFDGPVNCRVTIFKNEKLYGTYSGTFNGNGTRMPIADVDL